MSSDHPILRTRRRRSIGSGCRGLIAVGRHVLYAFMPVAVRCISGSVHGCRLSVTVQESRSPPLPVVDSENFVHGNCKIAARDCLPYALLGLLKSLVCLFRPSASMT